MKANKKNKSIGAIHSEKEAIINIVEAYKKSKHDILIKLATEYLTTHPDDNDIRFMRAQTYRKKGMYKKALEDLEITETVEKDYAIIEKFYIYYNLEMYDEAYRLLPELKKTNPTTPQSTSLLELILRKKLGYKIGNIKDIYNKSESNTTVEETLYVREQILDYNKENVKGYIKKMCQNDPRRPSLNAQLNIDYLYETVARSIKTATKQDCMFFRALSYYDFVILNIGTDKDGEICNYLRVSVEPQTNHIINMYPIKFSTLCCNVLEIDMDKLFNRDNSKQDTSSRVDKFKARLERTRKINENK